MKRILLFVFIFFFVFINALSFVGCSSASERRDFETRACWVSSIGNLDFPSKMGMSAANLRKEIDDIIINCKNIGLNTIFFQVRPNGDALYRSKIFPWSKYLSGKQGVAPDQAFDPLHYFVEKAHKNNIELHAWINPYRIGTGENIASTLSSNNPAILHPEYTIQSATGLYYNPGLPEVRSLILDGIDELISNYDVDGIHFDDYFYPYDLKGFDDSDTYEKYGNGRSLGDFRRESVDELVRLSYNLIKSKDPDKEFGISPFGIWANKSTNPQGSETRGMSSYSAIFSDSKKWVEKGWLDYICPQVYWTFDHEKAPYAKIVDWWESVCKKTDVKLYVGMAAYKINTDEVGWKDPNQIQRQLQYASKKSSYAGHCFFRYGVLIENPLGVTNTIKEYYKENPNDTAKPQKIDPLFVQNNTMLAIHSPQNNTKVQSSHISISGTTSAGRKVTVNGISAVVSDRGYFSAYVPLKVGENKIVVRSAGKEKVINVGRVEPKPANAILNIDSFYPNGNLTHNSGDVVHFSVQGDSKYTLMLTNGTIRIPFIYDAESETFLAEWTVPVFSQMDKLEFSGFKFVAECEKEQLTEHPVDLSMCLQSDVVEQTYRLIKDTYVFDESTGGSQMDHPPLAQGCKVSVVAEEGTRMLLKNGYWIEKSMVSTDPLEPKALSDYDYETVTLRAKAPIEYSVFDDENGLYIKTNMGRNLSLEARSETMKLDVESEYSESGTTLRIKSKADYDLAGYEIVPNKNGLQIKLRLQSNKLRGKTILLDAGHGGEDCGALGPGGKSAPTESELNFLLARYLKRELEEAGVNVLLTRKDNTFLELEERVIISENTAPDLFISLHHNSTDQTSNFNEVSGGSVLYSSELSEALAHQIAQNLWAGISKNPKVKVRRQSLFVCRQTRCPAILIEAGYLCNPLEYELLCNADNTEKIAKNIVIGLKNYFVSASS